MPRSSSGCRGFSLVEALVALAVAAVLTAAITRLVATTRVSAAGIGELTEMSALADTLMARVSSSPSLRAGRTDGRRGAFAWHIDIVPVPFTALARRISEKTPEDRAGTKEAAASGSKPAGLGGSDTRAPAAPPAAPPVAWIAYRVAVVIDAPSGRRYVVDTLRTGPQPEAGER
jgi:prepilin-type N-terminal cleavage/methylation domain-containing protein